MRIALLVFIVLLFSSCESKQPKLIIPNAERDKIYFQLINPVTEKFEIPKLRETYLSGDDLEVRVWVEAFGFDGLILKRINKQWSATAIKQIDCSGEFRDKNLPYQTGKINLATPKSGWEDSWQRLIDAGILDLPDASELPNEKSMIDGIAYVVETNLNGKYRVYYYGNPQVQEWKEAKQMMKIGEIIADEFGLFNFKYGSLCLPK